MQDLQNEMENLKPLPPVGFEKLLAVLPAAPEGFKAQKPSSESGELQDFEFSHAEVRFNAESSKSIEVKINDWAGIQQLYFWFSMAAKMKRESSDGYEKGIKIDDFPGMEKFTHENKNGQLQVLVHKQFLVEITTRGVPAEMLRKVYRSIDVKNLADLNKTKVDTPSSVFLANYKFGLKR